MDDIELRAWMRFVDALDLEQPTAWSLFYVAIRLGSRVRDRP